MTAAGIAVACALILPISVSCSTSGQPSAAVDSTQIDPPCRPPGATMATRPDGTVEVLLRFNPLPYNDELLRFEDAIERRGVDVVDGPTVASCGSAAEGAMYRVAIRGAAPDAVREIVRDVTSNEAAAFVVEAP
jgi:hypothetical protein